MLVNRRIPFSLIARVEGPSVLFLIAFSGSVYAVHRLTAIPVDLPVAIAATLGTAVAILLGFKNNSAYGRWWEARRIWGASSTAAAFLHVN